MIRFNMFAILAACLAFASCSTSTLYYKPLKQRPSQPWDGASSRYGGYIERSHGAGSYEISFEAYNRPNREAVAHFVLLRAAERTLIDGKTYFYADAPRITSSDQESYFPPRVIPGYWDTRRIRHCEYCPKRKQEHCHYDEERFWCPPEYIPERYVTNYIHKGTMKINYRRGGKRYNASDIVTRALTDTKAYGKPKLHPSAMARVSEIMKR